MRSRRFYKVRVRVVLTKGFTLIELLVSIVVICILLILTLSAAQSVRETARRTQCSNNLKQFGLALSNYTTIYGFLPLGTGGDKRYSIHVALLPYLDLLPLYNSFSQSILATDISMPGPNSTALSTRVAILSCPSDPCANGLMTNYAGALGDHRAAFSANGAFGAVAVGYRDITDGASATVGMSEFLVGRPEQTERLRSSWVPVDIGNGPAQSLDQFAARCLSLSRMIPSQNVKGLYWTLGQREFTLYDHTLPINQPTCANTVRSTEAACATTATSLHRSGANSLFLDGHVLFQGDRIDARVWRALGTRNGGEIIDSIGN
jgi:prepilin-type N-terminal cleavage/methylation domain-containing protein/prepilin-type processing-associated H-X9-DG protein